MIEIGKAILFPGKTAVCSFRLSIKDKKTIEILI
jgi:hypothetical protein